MKRKLLTALLCGALMLTSLAGCGQGAENQSDANGASTGSENAVKDELVFVNYRDIRDLNPHLYAGEMYAQSILYDTLVSNTSEGYVGCLAENWTISEDGRTYTFNIRDGVTFSDGTPCDAKAILANFNAILENRERHTWLEMMNLLVSVSAPDDDTFVIEMSEPYYPMLTELACIRPFAMISPNCMIDGSTKDGVDGYIGTGPYVLTDFVTDEYAVFERNENYWGEKPAIQKITVKVIPDNQTRIMALENGEIDLIFGKNMLDADAISQYVDSDKFTVGLSDPTSTRHIVLNTTHDILGDKSVRQALQHATNRQAISEGIFYGLEPAADTLYSTTVPYCDVGLEPYAYDVDEAARLRARLDALEALNERCILAGGALSAAWAQESRQSETHVSDALHRCGVYLKKLNRIALSPDPGNITVSNHGDAPVFVCIVDSALYPETAEHIRVAQDIGFPDILTLDRGGAAERRKASLGQIKASRHLGPRRIPLRVL